ncbi:MAG TPA: SigE family RNA polymerase sigma factor [Candidatus Limnocylindrales bacterium]
MRDPSFDDFVGECLPALSRYSYVLTGDVHAAEDLVQDSLVKLAGAWDRVRREGNPLGYARAVMFRTFVSRWRVLRRQPVFEALSDKAGTRDQFAEVDARDALRRAMAGLPRLQRAVLVLGYLDDMTDEDIARLLDRRPATVRSLRHRALHALRSRLEPKTVAPQDLSEVTHAGL